MYFLYKFILYLFGRVEVAEDEYQRSETFKISAVPPSYIPTMSPLIFNKTESGSINYFYFLTLNTHLIPGMLRTDPRSSLETEKYLLR